MADVSEQAPAKPERVPFRLLLGDPQRFFASIAHWLGPFIWAKYFIFPLIFLAFFAAWANWLDMQATLKRVLLSFSFLQGMLLGMFTSNLVSKLRQGLAMARYGKPPTQFGIRLLFGLIPRFFVNVALIRRLDFRAQRICYLTPLLTKLGLCAVGVLIWALTHHSGSEMGNIALAVASTCFGAFLLTANPLFRADGYRLATALTQIPDLREQAFRIIGLVLRRKPLPPQLSARRFWLMIIYAIGSTIFTAYIVFFIVSVLAVSLRMQFRGAGVALFCLLVAIVVFYMVSQSSRKRRKKEERKLRKQHRTLARHDPVSWYSGTDTGQRPPTQEDTVMKTGDGTTPKQDQKAPDASGTSDVDFDLESILPSNPAKPEPDDELDEILDAAFDQEPAPKPEQKRDEVPAVYAPQAVANPDPKTSSEVAVSQPPPDRQLDSVLPLAANAKPRRKWVRNLFWLIVLGGLILIGLQPYQFNVGGEFTVQPVEPTQVRARTDGEIDQLLVSEGDWVKQSDVLAVLSNWEAKRDIAVQQADLDKLQAELDTLVAGPKVEEIALAEQELASNDAQVTLAAQTLDRQETLFQSNTISLKALEEARGQYNVAKAEREKAQARLMLLKTGALDSEIAAAEAQISRKRQELDFSKLRLEHTNIRAVSDGQIVSSLSGISIGSFLKEGDLFGEIADNRTVVAEIEVPETEIDEVTAGAEVTLRPWSAPDTGILGTVKRIAPAAETRDFGKVVRVMVEVDNADGKLAGNMTGFAKVFVDERPVWRAFGRVFERFVRVEMWSWVP